MTYLKPIMVRDDTHQWIKVRAAEEGMMMWSFVERVVNAYIEEFEAFDEDDDL